MPYQITQHDFFCRRKFKDITSDENNFLVVVHALQTIVRHVIKSLFNTKFKDDEFSNICKDIYYGKMYYDVKSEVSNRCRKVKMHFSDRQRRELFSQKREFKKLINVHVYSLSIDMYLFDMIYIVH